MAWMGPVSAWTAMAAGAVFCVLSVAMLLRSLGAVFLMSWFLVALGAALLFIGGLRTLRGEAGGLRLLAGAWGFATGLLSAPLALWPFGIGALAFFLPLPALAGLALAVLHKERH